MVERESFGSKFGLLAVAIGSAVGLGNIWRFPYIVGENGGGAFLIIYLFLTAIIGVPLMIGEFMIGREGKSDAIGSFKNLAPDKKWYISGVLGVATAFLILSYYGVVSGWTLKYIFNSVTNAFAGKSSGEITTMFNSFISSPIEPILWQLGFMAITGIVVATGIEDGIEAVSKFAIPALLILIIILDVQAILLPGGLEGVEFLLKPDFSKIDADVVLAALGHAFYSLSLGMGIMITYGSYMSDKENLITTSIQISISGAFIAILAGLAIFPAVFSYGLDPTEGTGLVFVAIPNIFANIRGGYVFGILFFVLLGLAALTSTISLLEVVVAFMVDSMNMDRRKAALIGTASISLVGIIASLSQGPLEFIQIAGRNIFDFLDFFSANYLLPIAALISVFFLVFEFGKDNIRRQLTNNGELEDKYTNAYYINLKYIVPLGIGIVFVYQILF